MSTTAERSLRIGEVAELTGTTPRTIRYYEEIGLLPSSVDRAQGKHRAYSHADVERVREIVRMRDLLGLSLEQLSSLLQAETARAELRREWQLTDSASDRRRIIDQALVHISTQLELVRHRRTALGQLENELVERQHLLYRRLSELDA